MEGSFPPNKSLTGHDLVAQIKEARLWSHDLWVSLPVNINLVSVWGLALGSFNSRFVDDYYSFGLEDDDVLARIGKISICQLSGSRRRRAYRSSLVHCYSPFIERDEAPWCEFEVELLSRVLRAYRGAKRHTISARIEPPEP